MTIMMIIEPREVGGGGGVWVGWGAKKTKGPPHKRDWPNKI